jgi:hypothetical protein
MIKHCCVTMDDFLEENKVDIYYDKEFRRYSIGMKNGTGAVQTMHYCPWCGSKLPKSLFNQWFDILENEYGLEDIHRKFITKKDSTRHNKVDKRNSATTA